jgi:Ca-activated chloride channel family protein
MRAVSLSLLLLAIAPRAGAAPERPAGERGGSLEATVEGRSVPFPSLRVDISADVAGDLATVSVVQTFENPFDKPMHARYLFPLDHDAAVYEMTLEVGDERIRAVIQERDEAARTFEKAKSEGKAASLLNEHRPNMFTQDVANLMPGLPIRVSLRYVQTVRKVDGAYELVVPLVVGPRYQPAGSGKPPLPGSRELQTVGRWVLETLPIQPLVAGLDIPDTIEKDRVSLQVRLRAGQDIAEMKSATHALTVQAAGPRDWSASLSLGRTIDNRDFVLRYGLAGDEPSAGLLASRDDRGGYFSLLLEPPAVPDPDEIGSREMVFLLDCSGSMDGLPIEASKAFMREALRRLRPSDTFRIIRFSDGATEFSSAPLPADEASVRRGLRYVDSLSGEGGTEMVAGIRQALDVAAPAGRTRIVVFLTDGYIGNEYEVLALVRERIAQARLFAFGVGTGVNRFLLDRLGKMGRGFARYMDPTEDVDGVARELAQRLDAPVLTDVRIDWGGLEPRDVSPAAIPDVFAGSSVRVQGRYLHPGRYTLRIHGTLRGREATLPVEVALPEATEASGPIPLVWARSRVAELMDDFTLPPGGPAGGDERVREEVTRLGLEFGLVTRFTSFVAVSEKVYNEDPEHTGQADVPLHRVKGVSDKAYGRRPAGAGLAPAVDAEPETVLVAQSGPSGFSVFSGSPTPEPGTVGGLLVMLCAAAGARRRRRNRD